MNQINTRLVEAVTRNQGAPLGLLIAAALLNGGTFVAIAGPAADKRRMGFFATAFARAA